MLARHFNKKTMQKLIHPEWKVPKINVSIEPGFRNYINVNNSQKAFDLFLEMWDKSLIDKLEHFCVLFLNSENLLIGFHLLNRGSNKCVEIDCKKLLSIALACNAHSVCVAHNHPNKDVKPSLPDFQFTVRIEKALELIDMFLFDHLVISENNFFSFRDNKLITDKTHQKSTATIEKSRFSQVINENTHLKSLNSLLSNENQELKESIMFY